MDEGYTDEELKQGVVWNLGSGLAGVAGIAERIGETIARLQRERDAALRERDDARRVAKSVASGWMTFLLNGKLPESPDVDTALAYPEPKPEVAK